MTGRHPHLFLGKMDLPKTRDKLMAAMLKQQGYATAILGKWHLAGYPQDFTKSPMHPLECGFDYHFGTPGSNDVPAPPGKRQTRSLFDACDKFTFKVPLIRGRKLIEVPTDQELLTKRYTEEAIKWINTQAMAQQDASANPPKPFFLYLAHNMPHAPVFASENFKGKSEGGLYGDTTEEIDWSVGQVMKAIKEAKLDEKTLIVFTSDNGPWSMFGPHGGTAKPLRGEKGTSWEGGYRVPGIFRWPGKIKPGKVDGLAANLDLYSTFAKLTGGEEPKGLQGFISKDISGVLLHGATSPRKKWFYSSGSIAFRSGNYKIHLSTKKRSSNPDTRAREPIAKHDPPLLYDLSVDIGEQNNIAASHPQIIARLLEEMKEFRGLK